MVPKNQPWVSIPHLNPQTHPIQPLSNLILTPLPKANGRIPAIVDKTSGKEKRIFEGGAILLYLTTRYDTSHNLSFPYDTDEYWETVEWITWMQSGIGPMQGQANHFYRYAPTKIEYAINRYQTETKRLYSILNDRLVEQEGKGLGLWLVGGKYTIADLACFSWVNWAEWAGVSLEEFAAVKKWLGVIQGREATEKGVNIPDKFAMKEAMKTKEGEEEVSFMIIRRVCADMLTLILTVCETSL